MLKLWKLNNKNNDSTVKLFKNWNLMFYLIFKFNSDSDTKRYIIIH